MRPYLFIAAQFSAPQAGSDNSCFFMPELDGSADLVVCSGAEEAWVLDLDRILCDLKKNQGGATGPVGDIFKMTEMVQISRKDLQRILSVLNRIEKHLDELTELHRLLSK